jgi:hypothetical protein
MAIENEGFDPSEANNNIEGAAERSIEAARELASQLTPEKKQELTEAALSEVQKYYADKSNLRLIDNRVSDNSTDVAVLVRYEVPLGYEPAVAQEAAEDNGVAISTDTGIVEQGFGHTKSLPWGDPPVGEYTTIESVRKNAYGKFDVVLTCADGSERTLEK